MRLKMLASFAGDGWEVQLGEETERFTDAEAVRMIEAGYAVPATGERVERAVVEAPPAVEVRDVPAPVKRKGRK